MAQDRRGDALVYFCGFGGHLFGAVFHRPLGLESFDMKITKEMLDEANMPDTPTARKVLAKMLEEDDDIQDYVRPWVGLTDEEIWSTVGRIGTADSNVNPYQILNDARAIEQRLKEKNT